METDPLLSSPAQGSDNEQSSHIPPAYIPQTSSLVSFSAEQSVAGSNLSRSGSRPTLAHSNSTGAASAYSLNQEHIHDPDSNRIHNAVKLAGENAFGIVMVDVWLLEESQFEHVRGGLWLSPVFTSQQVERNDTTAISYLQRITDPQHPEYIEPLPQVMGVGLAGYFWSILGRNINKTFHGVDSESKPLLWRKLEAITSDPFQPPHPRIEAFEKAGFGRATGIPFDVAGRKGVVLFLTRPGADVSLLNHSSNIRYLQIATMHIGTACALTEPRINCETARKSRIKRLWKRVRAKLTTLPIFKNTTGAANDLERNDAHKKAAETSQPVPQYSENEVLIFAAEWTVEQLKIFSRNVKSKYKLLSKKWRGSDNLNPPPGSPLQQCIWTSIGTFLSLSIVISISVICSKWQILLKEEGPVLAPLGAFLTLQYSLTAAPASQPRNAVFGQLLCMAVACVASFLIHSPSLPTHNFLIEHRILWTAASVSAGVAGMQYFGLAHPPAAATMLGIMLRTDGFHWRPALFFVIANLLAIAIAILVNNLSEHRQYPVYWRLNFMEIFFGSDENLLHSFRLWARQIFYLSVSDHDSVIDCRDKSDVSNYGTHASVNTNFLTLSPQSITSKGSKATIRSFDEATMGNLELP